MKWFGKTWHAPVNMETDQCPVPVGWPCSWCDETIEKDDDGLIAGNGVFHRECFMRQIIGSVSHVKKQCSCFVKGASETDPPDISKREAAKLAVELWEEENHP